MSLNTSNQGAVIWISGFSAAGKTTVGRQVSRALVEAGLPALFLDGDQLRSILAHKWGYTHDERIELACTYFRLCSHLSKQGAVVVISAVAMLEEARRWFHDNVAGGMEFYLRVPLEERIRRDERTKGIYKGGIASMQAYTEPSGTAFIIDNYGDIDVDAAAHRILEAFHRRLSIGSVDHGRTEHWRRFYLAESAVRAPSPFALHCISHLRPHQRLLEFGCGNGRDANFFADQGLSVTAIDRSAEAIENCVLNAEGREINYLCCSVADLDAAVLGSFDVFYSRFVLHAMTQSEEDAALIASRNLLSIGGLLCIECRSINDSLAREGEVLSPTERISGHYRRFIVPHELADKLILLGFHISEQVEAQGLAVFGAEDPMVIRIVAERR